MHPNSRQNSRVAAFTPASVPKSCRRKSGWGENNLQLCLSNYFKEVFMSQGATGEISSGFERSPRNSDEELEMERTVGNARGKGLIDYDSSKDEVQVVAPTKKGKEKKRSAKHKPTDLDINSPIPSPSSGTATRYFRMLDSLESLVMKKRSTSTTSVSSPSKDSGGKFDFEKEYCLALAQLTELKLNWNEHMKVADVLKDTTELIIWMTARSDEDRRDFARMRGCI